MVQLRGKKVTGKKVIVPKKKPVKKPVSTVEEIQDVDNADNNLDIEKTDKEKYDKECDIKPTTDSMQIDDDVDTPQEEHDDVDELKPVTKINRKRKQDNVNVVAEKKQKSDSEEDFVTLKFENLPKDTTDKTFGKFLKSKNIQVKECRANYNRCKAFVDVATSDEEKALGLDKEEWIGSEIAVMLAQPKKQASKDIDTSERDAKTLILKNLPYQATEDNIKEILEDVQEVRFLTDRATGKSKGIAFVEFKDPESAEKAMETKSDLELEGRQLIIDYTDNRASKPTGRGFGSDEKSAATKILYVKGITEDMTKEELSKYFEDASKIRLLTKESGKNKSFAYVEFDSEELATKCLTAAKDGIETDDGSTTLRVEYSADRYSNSKLRSKTLFVKGVTEDMTKEEFSKYFDDASDVRMITDKDTGKNKFFAYVEFESSDLATKCLTSAKDGIEVDDGSTTLQVEYASHSRGGRGGGRGRGGRGRGFRGRGGRGFRGRGRRGQKS